MFQLIFWIAVAVAAAACLGHLLLFGPRHVGSDLAGVRLHRFGFFERFVHALTTLSFLALALSGFAASAVYGERLAGWMWVAHAAAALVFTVCVAAMVVMWASDCRFAPHDWEWAKHFGGYLGGNEHVPAGRFNCGQKALFWFVGLFGLASVLSGVLLVAPLFDVPGQSRVFLTHRYATFAFVLLILVHIYLATIANPGTLRSIITGLDRSCVGIIV